MGPRRLVRKAPLTSRIASWPLDAYLYVNEQIDTIEWDRLSATVSLPLGVALDAVLLVSRLACAVLAESEDPRSLVFRSTSGLQDSQLAYQVLRTSSNGSVRGMLHRLLQALAAAIVVASVANAYCVFFRRRPYTLLGKAPEDDGATAHSSAHKVAFDADAPAPSTPRAVVAGLWSALRTPPAPPAGRQVWELRVWNPPLFNLNLLVAFSPVHAAVLYFTPLAGVVTSAAVLALVSAQSYLFTRRCLEQQADKSLIFSEMFGEYEKKVVRPKLSVRRRDAAVGADGSVETYAAARDRTFVTRDVLPRPENRPVLRALGTNTPRAGTPLAGSPLARPSLPAHIWPRGSPQSPLSRRARASDGNM
ncbi:uncharacterized protein V1510DRAFT_390192 [Dipodascopsis tothii]|uniref:uncharacterized protein n=1 Tax=Dipodascopsis tothii TaxID=44089 RepID=UPI0034CE1039